MKEIVLNTETMTSLQIAEVTGKLHKDVLEAIRNMESAWVKVNGRKFPLVEYKDAKGEMRPMYQLNKTECLYVATKFKDEARARLVIRWEELERERMAGGFQIPQNFSEALRLAAEQAERVEVQQRQIEAMKPKALFADAVATSDRSCLVAELAKILQQNGVNIGQNRLFDWLRKNGYLCSKGEYYNQPTQRAMEMGLFEVKKTAINKPDGSVLVSCTTKVTGKGQVYFVNKFLDEAA
jgi:phage antirepressor YoqD-like protein